MRRAINSKDVSAGVESADSSAAQEVHSPPVAPMVVFINSRSGGRHGPKLMLRLQQLMSEEQVFDLSDVKPNEFVRYGLTCLEQLAGVGDSCAKEIRDRLRVVIVELWTKRNFRCGCGNSKFGNLICKLQPSKDSKCGKFIQP